MQMGDVQNWIVFSKDVPLILEKKMSKKEKIHLTSSAINQSGSAKVTLLLLGSLFFLK